VCCEAEKLLSRFMLDGRLDELEFKTMIGDLIQRAKQGDGAGRCVFGEMVALIWRTHPEETHRMEELWNHVISSHGVPLLYAYSLNEPEVNTLPMNLLACHSHALS
jgi:hypothetical protein